MEKKFKDFLPFSYSYAKRYFKTMQHPTYKDVQEMNRMNIYTLVVSLLTLLIFFKIIFNIFGFSI